METKLTEAQLSRVREAFENIPYARLLGIELGDLERGAATLYLNLHDQLKRNHGLLHGGATASLIDTAAAFAILTLIEPDEITTTVDLTVHYLRPLIKGQATARARVLRAGRRIITVSVDVQDEAETLAATALTTYIRTA